MSSEVSPEEIEELKQSIHEKLEIIKENADDAEDLEKWERFAAILEAKDSKSNDNSKKQTDMPSLIRA